MTDDYFMAYASSLFPEAAELFPRRLLQTGAPDF